MAVSALVGYAALTDGPTPIGLLLVGVLAGLAGSWAMPRASWHAVAAVGTVTAIALVIAVYYVGRLGFIGSEAARGRVLHVPLRPPWNWFWFVVAKSFRQWLMLGPYTGAAIAAAAWCTRHGIGVVASRTMSTPTVNDR
jgi:hypothetical protein